MSQKRNTVSLADEADDKIEQIARKTHRTKQGVVSFAVNRLYDDLDMGDN
jgi:predicted transcriptional regulator